MRRVKLLHSGHGHSIWRTWLCYTGRDLKPSLNFLFHITPNLQDSGRSQHLFFDASWYGKSNPAKVSSTNLPTNSPSDEMHQKQPRSVGPVWHRGTTRCQSRNLVPELRKRCTPRPHEKTPETDMRIVISSDGIQNSKARCRRTDWTEIFRIEAFLFYTCPSIVQWLKSATSFSHYLDTQMNLYILNRIPLPIPRSRISRFLRSTPGNPWLEIDNSGMTICPHWIPPVIGVRRWSLFGGVLKGFAVAGKHYPWKGISSRVITTSSSRLDQKLCSVSA